MKTIELFQPFLRKHILNFGLNLKYFSFVVKHRPMGHRPKSSLTPDQAFYVKKGRWISTIRKIIGIPNIQVRFGKSDLFFTYGSLLITNKPYCIYIESGTAIFDYDPSLARHPVAQLIVRLAILKKNCRRLIFMSKTAETGFLNTLHVSPQELKKIKAKCDVCYPIIRNPVKNYVTKPKKINTQGTIRFLYIGTFYIKGGLEVARAFLRLKKNYSNVSLTLISGLDMIYQKDKDFLATIQDLQLLESAFSENELFEKFYLTHDVFLYPTYRDSFGLILLEALSAGLPIIGTDQYATSEMIIDEKNGILLKNNPMRDYCQRTFVFKGKYRQPIDFYTQFFSLQKIGGFRKVEDELYYAMEKIVKNPELIERYSAGAIELYTEKFDADRLSNQIESIFLESLEKE